MRHPSNRPRIPLDIPWAGYWQTLQQCDAWWKRGPEDFSIFPPGKSWVGVIRKLRPSMKQDWSRFNGLHQRRLLGCAATDDDDWALLGNMLGFAIKPVFGNSATRRRIETTVKDTISVGRCRLPQNCRLSVRQPHSNPRDRHRSRHPPPHPRPPRPLRLTEQRLGACLGHVRRLSTHQFLRYELLRQVAPTHLPTTLALQT